MPLVVIDPGHGGRDPGTVGNGYEEKTLVLQSALRLRDALRRCGFDVIMTRETDTLPMPGGTIGEDLTHRAQIANGAGAHLYLSWHVDSVNRQDVNGVAAWIHPSARGTRTETIAQRIVNRIAAATGQNNRGVYIGDFAVLRETVMDAVLIEAGFITHVAEVNNLAAPSFQTAQAEGATQAVCDIFGVPYVPVGGTTPSPSVPSPVPVTPAPTAPAKPVPQTVVEEWPEWARDAIRQMIEWNVMVGYEDGTWRPDQTVTRAELASALLRFYNFLRNGGLGR
ncbi:MAG: N-acetylmuramoyl-L-alanine amidase [Tumebacillaceae bacterium]